MAKRKKQVISVWQALNQPVVEVTEEAAKGIFLSAAVILLMVWLMPSFGKAETISNENEEVAYQSMFTAYEQVAGATTEMGVMGGRGVMGETGEVAAAVEAPQGPIVAVYTELADTSESLGQFYDETVQQPFAEAAVQILDISQPVQNTVEFLQPGVSSVKDAWLELMTDPVY